MTGPRVLAVLALCVAVALPGVAFAMEGFMAAPGETELNWRTDWQDACAESRRSGLPVLAVSSLPQCPWCRAFERTLRSEAIRPRLKDVVLARIDLSGNVPAAEQLGMDGAPVSVLVSAAGVVAGRHEGYAPPEEFGQWLAESLEAARELSPAALAEGPAERLVALMGHRDPVARELAVTALARRGETVAVAEAFISGSLATRLSAMEALAAWEAPLGDADPWKPDTIAPVAQKLRKWAWDEAPREWEPVPPQEQVERDLQTWVTDPDGPLTRGAYARLARVGPKLLPLIEQRTPSTWNRARERLEALRYRLLMPEDCARRLPDIPFQMAATSPQTRLRALNVLSERAGPGLEEFFAHAARDPDGKVRQAAVRGLLLSGAQIAREELVQMLSDASAEVRAVVLKQLARSPAPELTPDLVAFVREETEVDLIVQGIGVLGDLRHRDEAFTALLALTEHSSWRVRAAAVQALGSVDTSSSAGRQRLSRDKHPRLVAALKRALQDEDVFVVSKAAEAISDLHGMDLSPLKSELAEVVTRDAQLAEPLMRLMASERSLQPQGRRAVVELCGHEAPAMRAAAVEALTYASHSPPLKQFIRALKDEDRTVRTRAAAAIIETVTERDAFGVRPAAGLPQTAVEQILAAVRPMASSQDVQERTSGLVAMAVLGETDLALPGLEEILTSRPSAAHEVVAALPALTWEQRRKLFELTRGTSLDVYTWRRLFSATMEDAPATAEEYLWQVFDQDPHVTAQPRAAMSEIVEFYEPGSGSHSLISDGGDKMPALVAKAQKRISTGSPARRAMALILLRKADEEKGRAAVLKMVEGPGAEEVPEELRCCAVQLGLAFGDLDQEAAIGYLEDPDPGVRAAAAALLGAAATPLSPHHAVAVGETWLDPYFLGTYRMVEYDRSGRYEMAELPEDFPLERLERVASELAASGHGFGDQLARISAYLRAAQGDESAMAELVSAALEEDYNAELAVAVGAAVAATGDDDQIKHARAVYKGMDRAVRDQFTLQMFDAFGHMTGPNALAFRRELLRARRKLGGW